MRVTDRYPGQREPDDGIDRERRKLLAAGLGIAAATLMPTVGAGEPAGRAGTSAGSGPSDGPAQRPMRIGVIGAVQASANRTSSAAAEGRGIGWIVGSHRMS